MFSVHQMHPEIALRLASSVALGGLAAQEMSLQSMITKYGTGLVIMRADVEYREPLTFFSASSVTVQANIRLRDDGRLIAFHVWHRVGANEAIDVRVDARPIKLTGAPTLDARPAPLDEEIRALFAEDEIVSTETEPTRRLQPLIDDWIRDAEVVGANQQPTYLSRSDCELADQWLFARVPSLVAAARDRWLLDRGDALSACLNTPLTTVRTEFFRPMFFGDQGEIDTTAYRRGDQTFFVHRVLGPLTPGGASLDRPLCALAVEVF